MIKVDVSLEEQPEDYLIDHPTIKSFYRNYSGDTVIVVGHRRPQKIFDKLPQLFEDTAENISLNRPIKIPGKNIVMLDTHAKKDGALSCVDILSGQIWQSEI